MGLPPSLFPPRCVCGGRISQEEAFHFLSCKMVRGSRHTLRHDSIVNALATWVRRIGGAVTCPDRDPLRNEDRVDLLVEIAGRHLAIDVAVAFPNTPARANLAAKDVLTCSGVIAAAKKRKHEARCRLEGYAFHPFVVEVTGGFHSSALKVVSILADIAATTSCLYTRREVSDGIVMEVSAALVRGNFDVWSYATNLCHRRRLWGPEPGRLALPFTISPKDLLAAFLDGSRPMDGDTHAGCGRRLQSQRRDRCSSCGGSESLVLGHARQAS